MAKQVAAISALLLMAAIQPSIAQQQNFGQGNPGVGLTSVNITLPEASDLMPSINKITNSKPEIPLIQTALSPSITSYTAEMVNFLPYIKPPASATAIGVYRNSGGIIQTYTDGTSCMLSQESPTPNSTPCN